MATAADVARWRRAQEEIARRVQSDVQGLWRRVSGLSPDAARDAFLEVVPGIVRRYGDAAAVVAAEYFEGLIGSPAVLADHVPEEKILSSVRYGVAGFYDGRPSHAVSVLTSSAVRHVWQYGRSTIHESSAATRGVSYARQPEAGACAWCLMLASRGAAYASRRSAGGEGNDYHDDCRCDPVPVRSGDDLPYDADALYRKYELAWEKAGGAGATGKKVAEIMREEFGLK